ncbi:Kelch motif family protein, partial [Reticulomyxa filosa]
MQESSRKINMRQEQKEGEEEQEKKQRDRSASTQAIVATPKDSKAIESPKKEMQSLQIVQTPKQQQQEVGMSEPKTPLSPVRIDKGAATKQPQAQLQQSRQEQDKSDSPKEMLEEKSQF